MPVIVHKCFLLNRKIASLALDDDIWTEFHREYCRSIPLVEPVFRQVIAYLKKSEFAYVEIRKEKDMKYNVMDGVLDNTKYYRFCMTVSYCGEWAVMFAQSGGVNGKSSKVRKVYEIQSAMDQTELCEFRNSLKQLNDAKMPLIGERPRITMVYRNHFGQEIDIDLYKALDFIQTLIVLFKDKKIKDTIDLLLQNDKRKSCMIC
jgi:hypothetical protein